MTFAYYTDAALTAAFSGDLSFDHKSDLSDGNQDRVIYFGNPTDGYTAQATSNPGVDQITHSITDADVGNGHEATEVRLASTLAGLDSATPGAALDHGNSLSSGVANAVPLHIRLTNAVTSVHSMRVDLKIERNDITETQD